MDTTVLDIQDDHGALLVPVADIIPNEIKTAAAPDAETLAKLPDDLFALVLERPGHAPLRKFACTDGPTTWVSAVYLDQTHRDLPPAAVKVAAKCLLQAAEVYGVGLPPSINGLAEHGGLETPSYAPEVKLAAETRMGQGLDAMLSALRERRQEFKFRKQSDLTGTEVMPLSTPRSPTKKLAAIDNHVVLSGPTVRELDPAIRLVDDAQCVKTASGTTYPLDKMRDILDLEQAFTRDIRKVAAEDRVPIAQALLEKEAGLHIPASETVRGYAGQHFRPRRELEAAMWKRRNMAKRAGKDAAVYDRVAGDTPHAFAEKLAAADRSVGLDREWDLGLEDPWKSVLSATKEAEIIYNKHNILISDHQIERMAGTETRKVLATLLEEDMVEEFIKDPVGVFKSLPDPLKRSIALLADDPVWRGNAT